MTSERIKEHLSKKKLLVVARSGFIKKNGFYYANPNEGVFVEQLSNFFSEIILCVNIYRGSSVENNPDNFESKSYKLASRNILIVELETDPTLNRFGKILQYLKRFRDVKKASSKVDYIFFFSTGYLGILSSIISKISKLPSIVYIGGDWADLIKFKAKNKGYFKKTLLLGYSKFIKIIQDYTRNTSDIRLIRGDELFHSYKKENSFKLPPMTNITKKDIRIFEDIPKQTKERTNILFVGRMELENGVYDFIEACKIVENETITPLQINMIGQGPLFDNVKTRALELKSSIRFFGYVENGAKLIEIYRQNNILVIPVMRAGLPRDLIEGLSQGLPIVATNTGGIPHIISNNKNGLLYEAGDYQSLANNILILLNDSDLCQTFSKRGIDKAKSLITVDTAAEFTAKKIYQTMN